MADVLRTLRTLVNKDDVRHWAAVNHHDMEEVDETTFHVGEYTVTFDENERLLDVELRQELPTEL